MSTAQVGTVPTSSLQMCAIWLILTKVTWNYVSAKRFQDRGTLSPLCVFIYLLCEKALEALRGMGQQDRSQHLSVTMEECPELQVCHVQRRDKAQVNDTPEIAGWIPPLNTQLELRMTSMQGAARKGRGAPGTPESVRKPEVKVSPKSRASQSS